jgi:hypothetical protein
MIHPPPRVEITMTAERCKIRVSLEDELRFEYRISLQDWLYGQTETAGLTVLQKLIDNLIEREATPNRNPS